MSMATKELFKKCVAAEQAAYTNQLTLRTPTFIDEGYVTTAFLSAHGGGVVEFRCGPAEYHVELFVHNVSGNRQTLSELIELPNVREWMQANRAELEGKQRVEAEVKYAFRLIKEALAPISEMNWLIQPTK